jgi:hypothetical protein
MERLRVQVSLLLPFQLKSYGYSEMIKDLRGQWRNIVA